MPSPSQLSLGLAQGRRRHLSFSFQVGAVFVFVLQLVGTILQALPLPSCSQCVPLPSFFFPFPLSLYLFFSFLSFLFHFIPFLVEAFCFTPILGYHFHTFLLLHFRAPASPKRELLHTSEALIFMSGDPVFVAAMQSTPFHWFWRLGGLAPLGPTGL